VQRFARQHRQHMRVQGDEAEGVVIRAGAELHVHQEALRAVHRHPAAKVECPHLKTLPMPALGIEQQYR